MNRILTHTTPDHEGKTVTLMGWVGGRRDHGKIIFIDLRDRSGIAQVVFTPKQEALYKQADALRNEWVIRVVGEVKKRPDGMENADLENGQFEVVATELEVITTAETPPFQIDTDGKEVSEEIRMEYRYLDLRRPRLQKNLRMWDKVLRHMRTALHEEGFTEINTPILSKSTPEGARDYLVPSRVHPGKFYALPQSPQQYKQLLMVAGFERYFQIAKCLRDEDTRGDRQPEFTQVDIEMSFVEQEDVLALIESLFMSLVQNLYPEKTITLDAQGKIPRMTYAEAMKQHGSDRPDVRKNQDDPNELAFLFVLDFPAFEWKEQEKRWDATHHPFTRPQVADAEAFKKEFKKDPGAMLAYQYDLVLNGYEIAGGSIRIHDPELLRSVFTAMGNNLDDVNEKFGHLLKAFTYGVPPHGGIAVGFDRLMMILQNESSIREVNAFPKTGDGRDLMMGAPDRVSEAQLKELHLQIVEEDNNNT